MNDFNLSVPFFSQRDVNKEYFFSKSSLLSKMKLNFGARAKKRL